MPAEHVNQMFPNTESAKELSSVPAEVPELVVRTRCILATLIRFHAVLCAMKASEPAAPAVAHLRQFLS